MLNVSCSFFLACRCLLREAHKLCLRGGCRQRGRILTKKQEPLGSSDEENTSDLLWAKTTKLAQEGEEKIVHQKNNTGRRVHRQWLSGATKVNFQSVFNQLWGRRRKVCRVLGAQVPCKEGMTSSGMVLIYESDLTNKNSTATNWQTNRLLNEIFYTSTAITQQTTVLEPFLQVTCAYYGAQCNANISGRARWIRVHCVINRTGFIYVLISVPLGEFN